MATIELITRNKKGASVATAAPYTPKKEHMYIMNNQQYTTNTKHLTDKQQESLLGLQIYSQAASGAGDIARAAATVAKYYERVCYEMRIGFNLIHQAKRRSNKGGAGHE